MIPISPELADQLNLLNPQQLAFLAGYAWAKSTGGDAAAVSFQSQASAAQPAPARRVRILSASQTGNARKVAEQLLAKLESAGVDAVLTAAADYKTKQLAEEDILLLVTSTQGEGEPPEEALPLHKFLNGKKAPDLSAVSFAVLGLGDSSYPKFCQAGRDFDLLLDKLGGKRLHEVGLCDLEYQAEADKWTADIAEAVARLAAAPAAASSGNGAAKAETEGGGTVYTKETPFAASLAVRQKITSGHADKDVEHIEIDLTGSGIRYHAGDALGVWPINDEALVAEILQYAGLDGSENIRRADGGECEIRTALREDLDITAADAEAVAA